MSKHNAEKSAPPEASYPERAAQMAAEKRAAVIDFLREKFAEFRQLAASSQFATVRGVNVAREMGQQIELFTGHEKLLPNEFQSLVPALADASLEFAKACLALHHKFPEPVQDYRAAAPEWERLLIQLELLPAGQRMGTSKAIVLHEPVKDCLAGVVKVTQSLVTLEKEQPMEQWGKFLLESFVREAEPMVSRVARARELLAAAE